MIFLTFLFSRLFKVQVYNIYTKYVLIDLLLSVRVPVNSRLLVAKFLGSQGLYADFQRYGGGVGALNPPVALGSTLFPISHVCVFSMAILITYIPSQPGLFTAHSFYTAKNSFHHYLLNACMIMHQALCASKVLMSCNLF